VVDETTSVTFLLRPAAFAEAVGGMEYIADGGFTFIGALGWAQLLDDPVRIIAGSPTSLQRQVFRLLYGSGMVVSLGFGYTFR
jgi:hypothetical protein